MNSQTKKSIIISLIILIVLTGVGVFLHIRTVNKVKEEANKINLEMSTRIKGATRTVYRAVTDIAQGQVVTAELVQEENAALSDTAQELMITAADFGKQATIDIYAGEDIHKSMVGEKLDKNYQEAEMNCIWLSTNLKQYDYVDIRVLFPNGLDYIVAAKKSVQSIKLSKNNVFFWLTEDEILNLDAAIVDANLQGAKLYTTKYVDEALEPANAVTYQPSAEIIDLIRNDPNVVVEAREKLSVEARADMESKLNDFKDKVTEQKKKDLDNEYNFRLDTTTDAGTGGKSDNNNGYEAPEGEEQDNQDSSESAGEEPIGSARNGGQ